MPLSRRSPIRRALGRLLLNRAGTDDGKLIYAGRVGT